MRSEFGAYIDPLADKALLVSIYVTLASSGVLPGWLAIVVVSRDLMIVGGDPAVLGHGPAGRDQAARRSASSTPRRRSALRAGPVDQGLRRSTSAGLDDLAMLVVAALTVASAGRLSRRLAPAHGGLS